MTQLNLCKPYELSIRCRSPSQFRILVEEAGVHPGSYSCDLNFPVPPPPHLRYVEEEDVQEGGCEGKDDEEVPEVHCVKQECRSAVAKAEFENDSMVR